MSLLFCGAIALFSVLDPQLLTTTSQAFTQASLKNLDWFYLLVCSAFVVLCLYLAFSRFGGVRLGNDNEKPEFSTASWLSMLFAAGMGSGLLFWGMAEPLSHFKSPPPGAPEFAVAKARFALVITNFHWGIHAWSIYASGALALAYFSFRKKAALIASGPIEATFSSQWSKYFAGFSDVIAVLAVIFGVVGSLGMGTLQMNSGLSGLFEIQPGSLWLSMGILVVMTICYMVSASTGLSKGIQILSNINMILALVLLLAVLALGPTHFLFSTFTTSIGDYLSEIISRSTKLYPFRGKTDWSYGWTLIYLIWWIAWAPFVGVFIARISRGRTIREFVTGVILTPTLFSIFWFAVMGGAGLEAELFGSGGLVEVVGRNPESVFFQYLSTLPWSHLWSLIAVCLIFFFLVTSADSACFVLGMMTSRGSLNPPTFRKLIWGVIMSFMVGAALFSEGGVEALKQLAIVGAIPFVFIMLVHCYCLVAQLKKDVPPQKFSG